MLMHYVHIAFIAIKRGLVKEKIPGLSGLLCRARSPAPIRNVEQGIEGRNKVVAICDYLDLEKYRWSKDCTRNALGVNHLMAPHFFNIRLFKDNREYCGNIYMLQLTCDSKAYLLIDRIQTAKFSIRYARFFQILRDALRKMFVDFQFHEILIPDGQISNNKSLSQIFHSTKDAYLKKKIQFDEAISIRSHFESLRSNTYRVLCMKN